MSFALLASSFLYFCSESSFGFRPPAGQINLYYGGRFSPPRSGVLIFLASGWIGLVAFFTTFSEMLVPVPGSPHGFLLSFNSDVTDLLSAEMLSKCHTLCSKYDLPMM